MCTRKCGAGKDPNNFNIFRITEIQIPHESLPHFLLISQVICNFSYDIIRRRLIFVSFLVLFSINFVFF